MFYNLRVFTSPLFSSQFPSGGRVCIVFFFSLTECCVCMTFLILAGYPPLLRSQFKFDVIFSFVFAVVCIKKFTLPELPFGSNSIPRLPYLLPFPDHGTGRATESRRTQAPFTVLCSPCISAFIPFSTHSSPFISLQSSLTKLATASRSRILMPPVFCSLHSSEL